MTYFSYVFLLDASIFTTIDEKKEEQKSTLQIFFKDVTEKSTETQLTLDNLNLSRKLPSKQKCLLSKTLKKTHSITRTLIGFIKFVFYPYNCLIIFFLLHSNTDSTLKYTNSVDC